MSSQDSRISGRTAVPNRDTASPCRRYPTSSRRPSPQGSKAGIPSPRAPSRTYCRAVVTAARPPDAGLKLRRLPWAIRMAGPAANGRPRSLGWPLVEVILRIGEIVSPRDFTPPTHCESCSPSLLCILHSPPEVDDAEETIPPARRIDTRRQAHERAACPRGEVRRA